MQNSLNKSQYIIQIVKNEKIIGYCGKNKSHFYSIAYDVTDQSFMTYYLNYKEHIKHYKSLKSAEAFASNFAKTLKAGYSAKVVQLPSSVLDVAKNGLPFTGCPECGSLVVRYKVLLPWYHYKRFDKDTNSLVSFEDIENYPQEGEPGLESTEDAYCADCGYDLKEYNV